MKSARTTLAYAAAIALVAFGLLALLNPLVAVRLVGLEVVEPRGLSEVRASYGAMLLAFGGVMLWAVPMRPRSAPWLRFAGVLFAAAALGRGASVLLDGVWTPVNVLMVAFEAIVAAAFLVASFQTPARRDRALAEAAPPAARQRRGLLGRGRRAQDPPEPEQVRAERSDEADEDAASDPLRALRS
jgi:hypothetical protein